jgi:isocitrate dehydrogenase
VLLLEVERQRRDGEVDAMKLLAWLRTIEDGIHTPDIFKEGTSKKRVGTMEFTKEVIARLGEAPQKLQALRQEDAPTRPRAKALAASEKWTAPPQVKILHGVDLFLEWRSGTPDDLAQRIQAAAKKVPQLRLALITNRGVKVWPQGFKETFCTDHWRCRFRAVAGDKAPIEHSTIIAAMTALTEAGLDVIKSENLCFFRNPDGTTAAGFSMGQGE